ncbi:uncharacterized protein LOC9662908 [Selaginella moellendorffii]|uniref:uncharacterized protein LOC9662908 n=1 Tax=Selaginella moellendorffii TaxID=88036 RepID=UPI000D1C8306|nr:uncharacterized protein LOC9662908 [Selaginella moellendorffii]|eukprot:XP_024520252.1 uncharacterized protein LOC9662908 [Selaginella moellendorffii]
MATLLLNGAGRYGRNGFFKMLRKRVSDLSVLSPREILNKQIEVWTSAAGSSGRIARIGMCSMGIALSRFLTVETGVSDELVHLQSNFFGSCSFGFKGDMKTFNRIQKT